MDKRVTIPVRVIKTTELRDPGFEVAATASAVDHRESDGARPLRASGTEHEHLAAGMAPKQVGEPVAANPHGELDEWRNRALRLQAEMDNFRKRQQRLAQDRVEAERQRMLSPFLRVVDDLERALMAPVGDGVGLRKGIELTRRTALQILKEQGVEQIESEGLPFDPRWHEAVTTVGGTDHVTAPNTVVQVLEPGYRVGEQLLRPAKVIVAT